MKKLAFVIMPLLVAVVALATAMVAESPEPTSSTVSYAINEDVISTPEDPADYEDHLFTISEDHRNLIAPKRFCNGGTFDLSPELQAEIIAMVTYYDGNMKKIMKHITCVPMQ